MYVHVFQRDLAEIFLFGDGVVTSLHVSTFCPITGPTTDCIAFCQIERKSVRRADESFTGY